MWCIGKKYLLLIVIICCTHYLFAQKKTIVFDTLIANKDSIRLDSLNTKFIAVKNTFDTTRSYYKFRTKNQIPKRAAMYSALVPGLGQVYNKQIWKTGIVYAGFGVSGYFIASNQNNYNRYRTALVGRLDNDPNTIDDLNNYSINDLRELQRKHRATLDRVGVFTSVWYGITIIDALVSAHLKDFNMSKNLSLHNVQPLINNNGIGLAFAINE